MHLDIKIRKKSLILDTSAPFGLPFNNLSLYKIQAIHRLKEKCLMFRLQLFDCVKATLADHEIDVGSSQINRSNDDLREKINEHKREEIKVGAKLFLNSNSIAQATAAIDHLLVTLDTCLDNLILAYHPKVLSTNGQNGHHNGNENGTESDAAAPQSANKEGVLEWGVGNHNALEDLKQLWQVLESYTKDSRISQLGIADLDTESLKALYATSVVKPTIAQINLSACCVVPGSLQDFCNKKEIQLLTHSDPEGNIHKITKVYHQVLRLIILFFFNRIATSQQHGRIGTKLIPAAVDNSLSSSCSMPRCSNCQGF